MTPGCVRETGVAWSHIQEYDQAMCSNQTLTGDETAAYLICMGMSVFYCAGEDQDNDWLFPYLITD